MTPLDDEFLPEEAKKTAVKLRKTTANLVRHFQTQTLQLKLKTLADTRQNEFAGLIESFNQMKELWWTKLTTPLEEVNSIKEQLRILQSRTQKLREIRDQKKENLQKYEEESKEQKEQREYEIQMLKTTIGSENANKEKELKELNDISRSNHDQLESQHKEEVTFLKKKIDTGEANLTQLRLKNKTDETNLHKEHTKYDRQYTDNLLAYDTEMNQNTRTKQQAQETYEQVHHELVLITDELKQRQEERKKRDEILAILKKKNEEQSKQMSLLNKGAEWVQAHWRGLNARREMEKARKGKKKKKKK